MPMNTTIPARHLLLALAVVAVWGSNFTVIETALDDFPPLLFAALRFSFAAVPAIFLMGRPPVPVRVLAAYGLFIGVGQFGVLYIAMRSDITPGLASLVIQMQVFFTVALALALTGERVRRYQVAALALAGLGIAVIGLNSGGTTTMAGLAMVLLAAFSWACGNIVGRRASGSNMLAFVAWSSLFAVAPLYGLSFAFEGWHEIQSGLRSADAGAWLAVAWQSAGNTIFGYGVWAWLLSRHPAAAISPIALLVPVFGMATAMVFLDEPMQAWKLAAASLVLSGLALNLFVPVFRARGAVLGGARNLPRDALSSGD